MSRSINTLIATHELADFDAFASLVGAQKLHPGASLAIPRSLGRDVHPYLALHRDRFPGVALSDIDWAAVERLILVDVRSASRLGHIRPLLERRAALPASLELVIYDHHPARSDDLIGDHEHIERVGSTATLLTERIAADGVAIDRLEATLLGLGIHADTGSLCFPGTTSRDATAVALLLRAGLDLSVLGRYLHASVSPKHRGLLTSILTRSERVEVGGFDIGIVLVVLEEGTVGLDEVTTRAHDALGYHALFAVYRAPTGKLQVVARSRSPSIDVAQVAAALGGGGHPSSASASVAGTLEEAREAILGALRSQQLQARTARDVMSSPVHTVTPDTSLLELSSRLNEWGHSGACVLRDGRVVAVISRRDLERARRLEQLSLKVKTFMSQRLFTASSEEPLERVLLEMQSRNIGRLPVLEQGRLVGIVTRRDVLRALYGSPAEHGA